MNVKCPSPYNGDDLIMALSMLFQRCANVTYIHVVITLMIRHCKTPYLYVCT